MPKITNRLSARGVSAQHRPGRYSDGANLYLSVSRNGGKRWVFIFTWQGRQIEMGLGSARLGQVSRGEARDAAAKARELLRKGVNPLRASRQTDQIPLFGEFADSLIDDLAGGFENEKHIAQWRMTLKEYAAPIRGLLVNAITTEDVLAILRPIWTTKAETASRVRGRIERVLSAAKARGFRVGENPAQWRGHLDQMLPKRRKLTRGHHAALPYADLPAFMGKLRDRHAPAGRALEFLILSATRSSEVREARWGEMNLKERIWTIPAARMKARREHRVPANRSND